MNHSQHDTAGAPQKNLVPSAEIARCARRPGNATANSMRRTLQQSESVALPVPTGKIFRLLFLMVSLCGLTPGLAAKPDPDVRVPVMATDPEAHHEPAPAPDNSAAPTNVVSLEAALKMQNERFTQGLQVVPSPPPNYTPLILLLALLLAAGIFWRRFTARLDQLFGLPAVLTAAARDRGVRSKLIAENPTMASFFDALREELHADPTRLAAQAPGSADGREDQAHTEAARTAPEILHEFFASAPAEFARLRTRFSEITRTTDEDLRLSLLMEFSQQVRPPEELSRMPELRPIWLMASALAEYLKQISCRTANVTPSTMRTAGGALDLLEKLCVPSLNPSLITHPPIRILAVDDDPICRRAIFLALKKVFNDPDLAAGGATALPLVAQHKYDVIFLDVDMPGMNGFELCSKIRESDLNVASPVVFVTRHSDFNSRAQSTLSGGQDLIGKPYLPFEIVVKALTFALRGRLPNSQPEAGRPVITAPDRKASGKPVAASKTATAPAPRPVAATSATGAALNKERRLRKKRKPQVSTRESSPLRAHAAVSR